MGSNIVDFAGGNINYSVGLSCFQSRFSGNQAIQSYRTPSLLLLSTPISSHMAQTPNNFSWIRTNHPISDLQPLQPLDIHVEGLSLPA